jgi:diadenosine tetraphosphate (Ap4A) HIT family hydrolase
MTTLIHQRVQLAREGKNPTVIARLRSGWVVLGDKQVVEGYCLLLPDPVVADLNALANEARVEYLEDMSKVGDALLAVTGADRINYAILGNTEPALHAHIIPRYRSEPEEYRKGPVWFYDWGAARSFDEIRDRALMDRLREALGS